jgi:hypothetical protein
MFIREGDHLNAEFVKQAQDQIKLNNAIQNQISNPMPAESLNGMSFKEMSAIVNRPAGGIDRGTRGGT